MNRRHLFTSNSKNGIVFILKCMFLALVIGAYIFIVVMPQYLMLNSSSLLDKVYRLENINGPKIVLIGNSNWAYGMNSQLLESEMDMPVVNMGLHAGLGNRFHEDMAKLNVKKGDIYVLCHTSYDEEGGNGLRDGTLTWVTIENHISLYRLIHPREYWDLIKGFPAYLKRILKLQVSGEGNQDQTIYSRLYYNEYGDNYMPRGNEWTPQEPIEPFPVADVTIRRINKLNEYLTSRGAKLVVAAYPIPISDFTADPSEYKALKEELSSNLDCPVISDFTDYMYDWTWFYDNAYHLTSDAADIRTLQLSEDLKTWFKNEYILP